MAQALIRINQPGHPTLAVGIPGRSRDDIVQGLQVELSNTDDTGVTTHLWEMIHDPADNDAIAAPSLLSARTSPTVTFTPNALGKSYLIQLTVNQGGKGEVYRILVASRDSLGRRVPAADEVDEANWLAANGQINTKGWQPEMRVLFDSSSWDERYIGDFRTATPTDLAAGVNPTVTVNGVTWTSNAGDAIPAVAQGAVTSFATTTLDGLAMRGANTTTNFSDTAHNAPHIFTDWASLLGSTASPEDLGAGVEYAVQAFIATEDLNLSPQGVGAGVYTPNDAVSPTETSPTVDESRISSRLEFSSGAVVGMIDEGVSAGDISGSRFPTGGNVVALIFRSGVHVESAVGVWANGFPNLGAMTRIRTWLGTGPGFTPQEYLQPQDRVSLFFQQRAGGTFDADIQQVRVLSKG